MLAHHRKLEEDRERLEAQVATLEEAVTRMAEQQRELEVKAKSFVDRAERHHRRMQAEAAQVAAVEPMLDAIVSELEDQTITFDPETGWQVRDPAPFRAAGKVWGKLEPAVRRLVSLVQAAEDGSWTTMSKDPVYTPLPRPAPSAYESSL
jgi:hypothetical protein